MVVKRLLSTFFLSRSGNVAMMFGLLVVPILIGAGIALDMARVTEARSRIAEAADAALLAAARARLTNNSLTNAAATQIARRQFDANARIASGTIISNFDFQFDEAAKNFTLTVDGSLKTTLLGITGKKSMPIDITSEAKVAPPRILEAVLVLDNTNSMDGAKMTALKDSATELVDTIMADSGNTVKVGVVPFSNYVNVGLSRRYASWIDVPADYSETNYSCHNTHPDAVSSNCHQESYSCTSDGVTSTCTHQVCDWDYGDPVEVCGNETSNNVWHGCVGSRNHPLNVKDQDFDIDRAPGLLNEWCPAELLPMTADKTAVKNKIISMSVQGDTYIPSGLTWGLRLISSTEPFTEGASYEQIASDAGVKALILMTDGANTRSVRYPDHAGSDASLANSLTSELCDEIKSKNVFIHAIAFEVSDLTIQNLLRNCATEPSKFYAASDATELADAFNSIGDDLQRLALSK